MRTTDELLESAGAGKGRKALAESTGISGKLLLKWVNRADLVSGIGSEYADLLEHAGIDSVPELAQRNAENLHDSLEAANSKRKLVRELPTAAQVADWIRRCEEAAPQSQSLIPHRREPSRIAPVGSLQETREATMPRTLLVVAALLVAAVIGWPYSQTERSVDGVAVDARSVDVPAVAGVEPAVSGAAERQSDAFESLARLLELEVEERQRLERELAALARRVTELEGPGDSRVQGQPVVAAPEPIAESGAGVTMQSFIDAGFSAGEAAYLKTRYDDAQMARLYLRDQAIREGWYRTERYFDAVGNLPDALSDLRTQMDETTLDRYLYATGRSNRVAVLSVLGSSAAEQAGLLPGDILYRYDNQRLYDTRNLISAIRNGPAGQSVSLEIMRDGQRLTVYVPRGPLGVNMSSVSARP